MKFGGHGGSGVGSLQPMQRWIQCCGRVAQGVSQWVLWQISISGYARGFWLIW
jgi:hypothetical protein